MAGPVRSSFWLQGTLLVGSLYFAIFFVVVNLAFIWKRYTFAYPKDHWETEYFMLWLMGALELFGYFLNSKGNLTNHTPSLVGGLFCTLTIGFFLIFLLLLQTYVLRIEMILVSAHIGFKSLQLIFGVGALLLRDQAEL